jgi:hypothetical protein
VISSNNAIVIWRFTSFLAITFGTSAILHFSILIKLKEVKLKTLFMIYVPSLILLLGHILTGQMSVISGQSSSLSKIMFGDDVKGFSRKM